jgi:hypothetical protein
MSGAIAASCLPVRLQGRINSLQRLHKVRLRGLGGKAARGAPRTCASATGALPPGSGAVIRATWRPPAGANKFAATTSQSPPARTRRQGGTRRPMHLRVRNRSDAAGLRRGGPATCRPPAGANEFAATTSQSPPARTRRPGRVRRPTHLRVRNRGMPPGSGAVIRQRAGRLRERINSPLRHRKVRLRGSAARRTWRSTHLRVRNRSDAATLRRGDQATCRPPAGANKFAATTSQSPPARNAVHLSSNH